MNKTTLKTILAAVTLMFSVGLAACGNGDDSENGDNGDSQSQCQAACQNAADQCDGSTVENCLDNCDTYSDSRVDCVANANSCGAIVECGSEDNADTGTDAGEQGDTAPNSDIR